jgi:hypothetical protein
MEIDSLQIFARNVSAAWGPLNLKLVDTCRTEIRALLAAPDNEPWLAKLRENRPAKQELYTAPVHGFQMLAHAEPAKYRGPHDHGQGWVFYAVQEGEVLMSTYARVADPEHEVRLVKRQSFRLTAGQCAVFLPGDIHDVGTDAASIT